MATLLLTAGAKFIATSFALNAFATAALVTGASLVGSYIDSQLFGRTISQKGPRLDEVRYTGSSHTAPINTVGGRFRVNGNIIWATRYREVTTTESESAGGKGGGGNTVETETTEYFISLAVGICHGPVLDIGRIWADGQLLTEEDVTVRLYYGDLAQAPDPKIVAVEGAEHTAAYVGLAYVVFEELPLENFGNRIPQFNIEVLVTDDDSLAELEDKITAVSLGPSLGEFDYSTTSVYTKASDDAKEYENKHMYGEDANFIWSMQSLVKAAPNCSTVVVTCAWHGSDLRINNCTIKPKVEVDDKDTKPYTWKVSGINRGSASVCEQNDIGEAYLEGTPSDRAVYEALIWLKQEGFTVIFCPTIVMDIAPDNTLTDPYTDTEGQAAFPSRSKLTLSLAPGVSGTTNGTAAARTEVETFFGTAAPSDFNAYGGNYDNSANNSTSLYAGTVIPVSVEVTPPAGSSTNTVEYDGPSEWSYRRMILHYATLCTSIPVEVDTLIDVFVLGSGLVGLTRIQDDTGAFPAVDELIDLAADVRTIVGVDIDITYAADWTEWSNYRPDDGTDSVYFPLDALWADANIDAVAINNFMPISDWRNSVDHTDLALADSIYDLTYLKSNIAAGEWFDWYYASDADRESQTRTAIVDPVYEDEDWVYRPKDIVSWWSEGHYERPDGLRTSFASRGGNPLDLQAVGGASIVASGLSAFLNFGPPAEIVSGGAQSDRGRATNSFSVELGDRVITTVWAQAGTSSFLRIWYILNLGNPNVVLNLSNGTINTSVENGHTINDLTIDLVHASGIYKIVLDVTVAVTDGSVNVDLGPNSNVAGQRITVFGVDTIIIGKSTTDWVPESKPIWFMSLGCGAVQNGTNQPDAVINEISDENTLPYFSNGVRDDYIQRKFCQAHLEYWTDNEGTALNPTGMVDPDKIALHMWDARPYPEFPSNDNLWADTSTWRLGQSLSGRLGLPELRHFIKHLFDNVGLTSSNIVTTEVYGLLSGVGITQLNSVREILDPIMFANFIQSYESNGTIVFNHKGKQPTDTIDWEYLVEDDGGEQSLGGPIQSELSDTLEIPQEVRLQFIEDNANYDPNVAYYRNPIGIGSNISESSVNVVMDYTLAEDTCARLLQEIYVGREKVSFKMPPSMLKYDPTDVINLSIYDRNVIVTLEELSEEYTRQVTATTVDPDIFTSVSAEAPVSKSPATQVRQGSTVEILNLPVLAPDATDYGVYFAAYAYPWESGVNIYRSPDNSAFTLDTHITNVGVIGVTDFDFDAGPTGRWDYANELYVTIGSTSVLSSASELAVLQGYNAAALYNAAEDEWEIVQWQTAELIANGRYKLTKLLRGQLGTEGAIADPLPEGSRFVVLGADYIRQSSGGANLIGLTPYWMFGPAGESTDSDSYRTGTVTVKGTGYRPYSPVSLKGTKNYSTNDITLTWIRRTRRDGDIWDTVDVPLWETDEQYEVDIYNALGTTVLRTITTTDPTTVYTSAMQVTDFGSAQTQVDVEVFQISEIYGRGEGRRSTLTFAA